MGYDLAGNQPPARESRYRRPRSLVAWSALLIGFLIGLGGGLFYAWNINPVVQIDTQPWQLTSRARAEYMAAIALDFGYDGDLNLAVQRLIELRPQGDPFQMLADAACQLATSGYVDSNAGLQAVQSMKLLYQLQGRTGCADTLVAAVAQPTEVILSLPTPTPLPPATKTPTQVPTPAPSPTAAAPIQPTVPVQSDFVPPVVRTFCDASLPGIIEIFVQQVGGEGLSLQQVRVRWNDGDNLFLTGLKPERGPGYADFDMEAGLSYIVDIPGRSDPTSSPLVASPCTTETGATSITSYRVFFVEQ
ncbi:MAG TPA: hypothetical protein PLQ56_06860 [Aggregatilineales bacterium]|nr:hypothetical protein [Aggregatilineales bacterium]